MENFVVSVRDIAYLYSQDGSVIPFIRISPFIDCGNGNFITGISLTLMDNDSDFDVVAGDVISVGIRGIKFVVKIIDRAPVDRTDIRIISCPVCHQPLTFRNGFSYCCNCDCRAQLEENIFATFSAYGIVFEGNNLRILYSLISRLLVRSPADLFWLNTEQICSEDVSITEAQLFQQFIHCIRGNVTLFQFFKSLNIFEMTDNDINSIVQMMTQNNMSLLNIPEIMNMDFINSHPEINWSSWLNYISCENNRMYAIRLSKVLYI